MVANLNSSLWGSAVPISDIAVDLGTSRTRVWITGGGLVVDEPSFLAYSESGEVVGAGRAAWRAASSSSARLVMPVRGGVVVDAVACAQMLSWLLRRASVESSRAAWVSVGIPETTRAREALLAVGVVTAATGGRVRPVPSTIAAARAAARSAVAGDGAMLVCDIGAGVTELSVVSAGTALSSYGFKRGARYYEDYPTSMVCGVASAVHRTRTALDIRTTKQLDANPIVLSGGGALLHGFANKLAEALAMPVEVHPAGRAAVVRGLKDI